MEQKIRRDRNMGDNLRRLRGDAGLSQEKLCAELQRRGCDIGRTTYAKYEAGELNIRASVLLNSRKSTNAPMTNSSLGLTLIHNYLEIMTLSCTEGHYAKIRALLQRYEFKSVASWEKTIDISNCKTYGTSL